MSCSCKFEKSKDLAYIKELATKQSKLNQESIQIYRIYSEPIGYIYRYEPINKLRENIIEIIQI